ncbi:uncharacterized protein [Aegilops tauschii subsp. strangulata]|uniref:uncharacterized protein isoform X1 n=1 Tax=Aegilops tauschii subsp. strangulata TaxID=200361 RepID=UPI00098BAB7E|nr:uncharacterized protein LOC109771004 isoform X1 [Aegilops tauschii subsp. strangulata]XP_044373686.1 uncharacterized protein LOC123096127 isoform X1 [Triticum aestivum]
MATAEEGGNGLEFLSDPVDRFPLPDLASSDLTPTGEPDTGLTQSAAESSMGYVGDLPLTIQLPMNNGCEELSLSAADSQQSTGKDDPQAPGWTKRFVLGEPLSSMHLVLEEYVPFKKP